MSNKQDDVEKQQYRFANNPLAHQLFYKYRSMVAEKGIDEALADIAEGNARIVNEAKKEANASGHWFARQKQLDAYWNFAYYCNCGFGASNRKAIDGHVEWKKATLSTTTAKKGEAE